MSAEGFVAIPKSPTTETSANMTSIASAVAAGREKKEKEKGKKRAKVFVLGRLMVKEVLGGGGNGNTPVQKEVIASNGKVPLLRSRRSSSSKIPDYPPCPTNSVVSPIRRRLSPSPSPPKDSHTVIRTSPSYPHTSFTKAGQPHDDKISSSTSDGRTYHDAVFYSSTQFDPPLPAATVHGWVGVGRLGPSVLWGVSPFSSSTPIPPSASASAPASDAARPPKVLAFASVGDDPDHFGVVVQRVVQRENSEYGADEPVGGQSVGYVGATVLPVERPRGWTVYLEEEDDINRLAEDAMREGDPYGQHLQPQHQVYGNPLLAPSHLAPLSAEHLDSFVPPVQRKHSMQELQTVRDPCPRPSALSFGGAAAAASRPLIPNVVIDHGTPLEEESDGRFASARPTSPPVPRDSTVNKRASRPLPKTNARGGVSGAVGNEDDPEWVLSESVTVVGFPTTQSSDSFQFDTKEGVKRSASSLGTASPAPSATPTAGSKRESRSGTARAPGGVEVQVVREEWSSVTEQDEEDSGDVEIVEDAAPRVQPRRRWQRLPFNPRLLHTHLVSSKPSRENFPPNRVLLHTACRFLKCSRTSSRHLYLKCRVCLCIKTTYHR
ncbi:hypothetical protein FRC00_013695 [Tulasnella sp. 408]|nr:hypothetical protein FRC00_013695 [Tulasnella sp. 408]